MKIARITEIIIRYHRFSIIVVSLIISLLFVLVKNGVVHQLDIEISTHMGQENANGKLDFGDYTWQVNNLIENRSFKLDGYILNRYPPIYPILLYSAYWFSNLLNISTSFTLTLLAIVFNLLSALILTKVFLIFYNNKLHAFIAGLIFFSHPYILQGLTKTMSVTPFMAFIYLSFYIFCLLITGRNRQRFLMLVISGFSLGIAMLIRPIGLFLPLIYLVIYLCFSIKDLKNRILKESLVFILSAAIVVAPWQIFNSQNGQSILLAANSIQTIKHGITFNNSPNKDSISLPEDVNQLAIKLSTSDSESSREFIKEVAGAFLKKPITVFKLYFIKAMRSWYGAFGQEKMKETIKLVISLMYIIFTTLGILKLYKNKQLSKILFTSFIIILLYFWAITTIYTSIVRYMIPVFGMMSLFIPGVLFSMKETFRKASS